MVSHQENFQTDHRLMDPKTENGSFVVPDMVLLQAPLDNLHRFGR